MIVGAGEVGQVVAQEVLQHPEYGINLVGFVDDDPPTRRAELESHCASRVSSDSLPEIMRTFDVDRVVIAFSRSRRNGQWR